MRSALHYILLLLLCIGSGVVRAQWCPATTTTPATQGCSLNFNVSFSTTGGTTNITNNNTNCSAPTGAGGYTFYSTMPHTGVQGTVVNFSFTNNPTWNENYGLWVDWNQDFDFDDPGETVYGVTNVSIGSTVTGSFTIPITAVPGTTRMRLRTFFSTPLTPCNQASNPVYDGETEDYPFNVVAAVACSGTPTAGTAVANPATPCMGNTTNLSLSGAALNSGITYQWEEQTSPGIWTAITGATSPSYNTTAITASRTFRCKLTCTNGSPAPAPAYSVPVTVAPYTTSLPYLETFESITANNQLPNCMTATAIGSAERTYTAPTGSYNQINHTPGGSKFGSFYWTPTTNAFFTPAFNLTAGTTYEFSFWYICDGYSGWNQLSGYFGTSPTIAGMTNLIGNATPAPITNTTYKRFVGTFTPATTGVYYMGVVCNHTTAPWYLTVDDIGLAELPACNGQPTGGAAVAVPSSPCPGSTTELTLNAAATYASGLTYQWEQSTAIGGPYTSVTAGTGATTRYYTSGPISAPTYYRAKLVCTNGTPDSAYSAPALVSPVVTTLPYSETFESITSNNQYPNCMSSTNLNSNTQIYTSTYTGNQTNHTPGGSKFGMFYYYPAGQNAFFTPGITLQAGKTYLFTFWYVNYSTSATGITTLEAYYGTSPTVAAMTNLIGTAAPPMSTTYQQFQMAFTPTTTGLYYVGITATSTTSGTNYYTSIDDLGLVELVPCSGKPDPGVINPVSPCPNQAFTLTVNGGTLPTTTGNLTFQWEDSSAATGGVWQSSLGISTNPTLNVAGITQPTKYRRRITCTNSGLLDVTPAYMVTPASFISCYCVPTYSVGSTASVITNVKLGTLNNTSTGASPWYVNYAPQQPATIAIPNITMGSTDTLSVTHGTYTTNYSGVWIDFNHNGVFDASEYFTQGTTVGASGIAKIAITPPLTAVAGLTRMRIRAADRAALTSSMACGATASSYGEAEDYLVNVLYPVCSGPTEAGRVVATDTAICVGYSIDLYDTTHEYRRSQISWSWESSTDGGFTWNSVAGTQNKDTLLNVLVTGAVKYRVKMMCNATGDSSYSVVASIRIKAPYECYCYSQSNGGSTDSSDIGAVTIGNTVNATGGPHILNPTAVRRRTDYTGIPNILLSTNHKYRLSIYHIQRNGVHADALVTVFMDYNNDFQYDAFASPNSERVFQGITTAGNFYIDTAIMIPNAVVPNAPTGMRVILNNDLNPNSPANLGCGPYVSGETEDYVVMFTRNAQSVGTLGNLEHVSLYPNPTTGKFVVTAGAQRAMGKVEVQVTTLTGAKVLGKSYSNVGTKFAEELDLGEVARGVYFVEVKTTSGDKMVQKLIVK